MNQPEIIEITYVAAPRCERRHTDLRDPKWAYRDRGPGYTHEHAQPVYDVAQFGTVTDDGLQLPTADGHEFFTISVEISQPGPAYDPNRVVKALGTGTAKFVSDLMRNAADAFAHEHGVL